MNNSTDYHQPVLEALSAFVRMGTETATGKGPPANDIQAALAVMGRCISGFNERNLNLAKAHIPKADLSNAHLSSAHLGDADLDSALLPRADLSGADLSSAHLTGRCSSARRWL